MALNDCAMMFSPENHFDTSTGTNLGAAPFLLSNLADPEMYTFWRALSGNQFITREFDGVRVVDVVSIHKVNFLPGSRWRIRLANTSGDLTTSPVFDSGWVDMFPGLDLFGIAEWGEFDWGGYSYGVYLGDYNRQAVYVLPPGGASAKFIRIDFDISETVATLGYGQAARLWIGEGYQPTHSAVYGSGVKFIDDTKVKVAESGVKHRTKRIVKRRAMRVILEKEPKLELFYRLVSPIIGSKGASKDFLTLLEPRDTPSLTFQTIYGSISDNTVSVTHESWNRLNTTIDLEESI